MTKLPCHAPFIAIALGSLALLLIACAPTISRVKTYAGPARPAEEVALLKIWSGWRRSFWSLTDHRTTVTGIDGQAIHVPLQDELEVLAGAHKVQFQYDRIRQSNIWVIELPHATRKEHPELEFEARAGRQYIAFGFTDWVDSKLYLWLIDIGSCAVVAGEPPPLGTLPCKESNFVRYSVRQGPGAGTSINHAREIRPGE